MKNPLSIKSFNKVLAGAKTWRDSGGMDKQYRNKISESLKGKPKPSGFGQHLSDTMRGENHSAFKGYYVTPFGKLASSTEREDILPNQLVRRWCKNSSKIITIYAYTQSAYLRTHGRSIIGKSFNDIRFESINN